MSRSPDLELFNAFRPNLDGSPTTDDVIASKLRDALSHGANASATSNEDLVMEVQAQLRDAKSGKESNPNDFGALRYYEFTRDLDYFLKLNYSPLHLAVQYSMIPGPMESSMLLLLGAGADLSALARTDLHKDPALTPLNLACRSGNIYDQIKNAEATIKFLLSEHAVFDAACAKAYNTKILYQLYNRHPEDDTTFNAFEFTRWVVAVSDTTTFRELVKLANVKKFLAGEVTGPTEDYSVIGRETLDIIRGNSALAEIYTSVTGIMLPAHVPTGAGFEAAAPDAEDDAPVAGEGFGGVAEAAPADPEAADVALTGTTTHDALEGSPSA